jgi:hypothetical protein
MTSKIFIYFIPGDFTGMVVEAALCTATNLAVEQLACLE